MVMKHVEKISAKKWAQWKKQLIPAPAKSLLWQVSTRNRPDRAIWHLAI